MVSDASYNPKRLKIMFMGDSLTTGVGNAGTTVVGGCRSALIKTIIDRLKYVPEFLGSQYTNLDKIGLCGASGLTVANITATPYAAVQLAQYKPDVIFLHIGTNDCTQLQSGGSPTLATSRANLTTLLDNIRTALPKCIVFLAKIIDNNTAHTEVVNYNASITTDTEARSDYASGLIVWADMYTALGLYSATYWADGTHLNGPGYAIMATTWQTAFNTKF